MLKHLSICSALVAFFGTGPLCAQEQEASLVRGLPLGGEMMTLEEYEKFENQRRPDLVPSPSDTAEITPDLGSPDALVVHLMTPEEFERFENQRRPAVVANPDDTADMTRTQASANPRLP